MIKRDDLKRFLIGDSKDKIGMYYALKAEAKKKGNKKQYEHFDKLIKKHERKS